MNPTWMRISLIIVLYHLMALGLLCLGAAQLEESELTHEGEGNSHITSDAPFDSVPAGKIPIKEILSRGKVSIDNLDVPRTGEATATASAEAVAEPILTNESGATPQAEEDQSHERDSETNLDTHYKSLGLMQDQNQNKDKLILQLPISTYFDVIKGSFRFGALAEHAYYVFPDLVSTVTRRLNFRGQQRTLESLPVLNVPDALMYGMLALQGVDKHTQALVASVEAVHEEQGLYQQQAREILLQYTNDSYTELDSEAMSTARAQAAADRAELYTSLLADLDTRTKTMETALQRRMQQRAALHEEAESGLLSVYREHLLHLASDRRAFLNALDSIRQRREEQNAGRDRKYAQSNYDLQARRVDAEVQAVLAAAEVRVEEAYRVARETEQTALNVLKAEAASASQETEVYLRTLFAETRLVLLSLFGDVNSAAHTGGFVLLVVLLLVLAQEVVGAAKFAVQRWSGKRLQVTYHAAAARATDGDGEGRGRCMRSVPIARDLGRRLDALADTYYATASSAWSISTPSLLPHALLHGYPGCGQQLAAQALAQDSGLAHCVVDARDLVSIGTPAGVHLRELVDRFAHSRTRSIVVLLHADDILAARGSGGDHDGSNHGSGKSSKSRSSVVHDHSAAEGCLYSLLELLKVNRPCCGLVITTGLPLGAIDAALLDRLDHTVELPMPADALRLRYCLGLMQTRLQQYLPVEARTELGQLLAQTQADSEKDEKGSSRSCSHVAAAGSGSGGRRRRSRSEPRSSESPELTPTSTSSSSSSSRAGPASAADRTKRMRALEACISSLPSSSSSSSFDVARASRELVVASGGWSLQDLERLVDRSVAACLGTEACVLSTRLFLLELKYLLEQK